MNSKRPNISAPAFTFYCTTTLTYPSYFEEMERSHLKLRFLFIRLSSWARDRIYKELLYKNKSQTTVLVKTVAQRDMKT